MVFVHMHVVKSGYFNISNRHSNFIQLQFLSVCLFRLIPGAAVPILTGPFLADS